MIHIWRLKPNLLPPHSIGYRLLSHEIFIQVVTVCIAAPLLVIHHKSLVFQEGSNSDRVHWFPLCVVGSELASELPADVQEFMCTQVSVGGGLTAWRSISTAISTITLDGSMCRMYTPVVSVVIAELLQHLVGIVIRILLLTHLPPFRHTSRCCVRLPQPESLCVVTCRHVGIIRLWGHEFKLYTTNLST